MEIFLFYLYFFISIMKINTKYFSEEYRNLSESIFVENNARFSDYNILP